ncbi:substrate-binding domain-containing protein, partial [Rhizobium ruizarguesonis]
PAGRRCGRYGGGRQEYYFAHDRCRGWREAMEECGLATDLCAEGAPLEQGGYLAALELLRQPSRPTALVCATDEMAIGALRALREVDGGNQI